MFKIVLIEQTLQITEKIIYLNKPTLNAVNGLRSKIS